jgi:hypothetical protein
MTIFEEMEAGEKRVTTDFTDEHGFFLGGAGSGSRAGRGGGELLGHGFREQPVRDGIKELGAVTAQTQPPRPAGEPHKAHQKKSVFICEICG